MNFYNNMFESTSRMINSNVLIFISLLIIFFGCSKDISSDPISKGELINLTVNIAGVKEPDLSNSLKASLGNQIGLSLPDKQNLTTVSKGDFALNIVSTEENLPTDIFTNSNNNTKPKFSVTENMKSGIRYRVLLYKASTDQLYSSFEAKAEESTNISVTSGETYKWYAYSYNTSDPIPQITNPNNPSITTPTTTTLLYASGTIIPIGNGTPLSITFAHQLTQLKVEIKEGMRKILSTSGKFASPDYVKTCSFNLKNGTKGTLTSQNITDLTFLEYTEGEGDLQLVTRVAKYYTADETINTFDVEVSSIGVQYTSTSARTLTTELPNNGETTFTFPSVTNSKGRILHGTIKLSFLLPFFNILVVSNNDDNGAFRLHPNTRPGKFIRETNNFGPTSTFVRTKGLNLSPVDNTTLMENNSNGWNRFKALMNNPANYPDVLIIANWYNYLDNFCWDLVNKYLEAGGNVFYTHDNSGSESYAQRGIANILGDPVANITMSIRTETGGVYKYNNTNEAGGEALILNGPFGNLTTNSYWGQDRVGSTYVRGFDPTKIVMYTNTSENINHTPYIGTSSTFFRVKSKAFIYVGDGGFYCNSNEFYGADNNSSFYGSGNENQNSRFPFRTDVNNAPYAPPFGYAPQSGTPAYKVGGPNVIGQFHVSNAAHFGNTIAWMLNRAHYSPINKTGPIIVPTP